MKDKKNNFYKALVLGFIGGVCVAVLLKSPLSLWNHRRIVEKFCHRWHSNDIRIMEKLEMDTKPPMVSFAQLVDAGDLKFLDLAFPQVPASKESLQVWRNFIHDHNDVVYSFANASSAGLTPSGHPNFHINIWFKPSCSDDEIKKLIYDIDCCQANYRAASGSDLNNKL